MAVKIMAVKNLIHYCSTEDYLLSIAKLTFKGGTLYHLQVVDSYGEEQCQINVPFFETLEEAEAAFNQELDRIIEDERLDKAYDDHYDKEEENESINELDAFYDDRKIDEK